MTGVTQLLHDHYRATFLAHGATSQGVDWGPREEAARLRQDVMLAVVDGCRSGGTLLDVGCGYGALADRIVERGLDLDYVGIDVVAEMVAEARRRHPGRRFIHGDFLSLADPGGFDYVVCNGILTQKLAATTLEMNAHARRLIAALFAACRRGVAFNVMTTHVNYQADNLYYRNPAELVAWCMSELTPWVRLDHAYPLWEYTVYLHRDLARQGPGGCGHG
ncbi:MAG: class I SAM-dependent methyltransferase [Planctomycetes bacterium]|nr:class I SAM-dependent methyltransferase [Planctomycetota bacterium]MBM4058680.1 class I SAM-dependent methyltransferase [Planctomycetota bacterium]